MVNSLYCFSDPRYWGCLRGSLGFHHPALYGLLPSVLCNAVLHTVRPLIQTLHSSQGDQRCVYVFALRKRRLFGRKELRMGKVNFIIMYFWSFFNIWLICLACVHVSVSRLLYKMIQFKMAPFLHPSSHFNYFSELDNGNLITYWRSIFKMFYPNTICMFENIFIFMLKQHVCGLTRRVHSEFCDVSREDWRVNRY